MKDILFRMPLVLIGLLAALLASEKISGWYLKRSELTKKLKYVRKELANYHHPDVGDYDNDLGWELRPNSKDRALTSDYDVIYKINSKGIRDKEIPYRKPRGQFRILALGESTVMGEGIKYGQRFTEVIEKAFKNVEVVNMGIWGFGMDQSFLQLKRDGFKYHPDLVILFVIDNFMQRCKDFIRVKAFKPRFVLSRNKDGLILQNVDFVRNHFGNNIYVPSILSRRKNKESEEFNIFKRSKLYVLASSYKRMNEINKKLAHKDRDYWRGIYKSLSKEEKARSDYSRNDFNRLIFLLLKDYKKICDKSSTKFLVVYIDNHKPQAAIKEFCKKLDIPCLDLSNIMAKAGRIKSLRFTIDPHYNSFAHRVIGEYTADYLKGRYHLKVNPEFVYRYLGRF